MMMKKMLSSLRTFPVSLLLVSFVIFPIVISCKSTGAGNPDGSTSGGSSKKSGSGYTECEERCEYAKRDCIERCENYSSFGFSMDMGGGGSETPYACTDKCNKNNRSCLDTCGDKK